MAQVTFVSSSVTNTNLDLKAGNTVTVSFAYNNGTLPPAGSTLQSVSVSFGAINVYISNGGFSTAYGNIPLDEAQGGGSQANYMTSLKSSLLSFIGGNVTFTVTRGSAGSGNVLNVRSQGVISMTINYIASTASTGSLTLTSIPQAGQIGMNITPGDGSYTHAVVWYRGIGYSETQNLGTGITSTTFTVPGSWPTGGAVATLISYYDSAEVGRYSYAFTITVNPSSVIPTAGTLAVELSQPATVPETWDVFVKGYSKAQLTLSGSSPGSGASYKSILLTCGSQSQSTRNTPTFLTSELLETGTLVYRATVTNNFGNAVSTSNETITVYDYHAPVFQSVVAFRCTSDGTPSDTGAYISVLADVGHASVAGKNGLVTLQAQYAKVGTASWSDAADLTEGQAEIIGGGISGTELYQVRITAIDELQNAASTYSQTIVTALTSEHVIFCKDGGLNVAFGIEGTRNNAVEITSNWDLWHGDEKLSGTVPVTRGGTDAVTAAAALYNLIGALEDATPVTADRFPFLDADQNTSKYVTLTDFLTALGFVSGILPITQGGTGAGEAATAISNLGITPANIGAATTNHNQAASTINSGTFDEARLPFKVRHGTVSITGVSWSSVNFSGFTYTPTIVVSYAQDASSSGISPLKTKSESTSGFEVCMAGSSGSGTRQVNWIAIGT